MNIDSFKKLISIICFILKETNNMINTLTEKDLIKGNLYKIVLRDDLENYVKEKYKYYYYEGIVQLPNWNPFHCFVPKIKKYKKNVLPLFINSCRFDYEYAEGKTTESYYFMSDAFIDGKLGQIIGPPIKSESDDLYGYDTMHFNIINP